MPTGIPEGGDSETGWTFTTLKLFLDERFRAQEESSARDREERRARDNKSNEFREQLKDQASTFATRTELAARLLALEAKVDAEVKSIEQQLKAKNVQALAAFAFGLLATAVAIFNTAMRIAGG